MFYSFIVLIFWIWLHEADLIMSNGAQGRDVAHGTLVLLKKHDVSAILYILVVFFYTWSQITREQYWIRMYFIFPVKSIYYFRSVFNKLDISIVIPKQLFVLGEWIVIYNFWNKFSFEYESWSHVQECWKIRHFIIIKISFQNSLNWHNICHK